MSDIELDLEPEVDLDLEALVIKAKNIRLPSGQVVAIQVPSLATLFNITKLGNKVNALAKTDKPIPDSKKIAIFEDIKNGFMELIPELAPYKEQLNDSQIVALLEFVAKISMPKDLDELEKRGITLDDDQKKVLADFLGQ